jgi:hypothetical protein
MPEKSKPFLVATREGSNPLERAVGAIVAGITALMHPKPVRRVPSSSAQVSA